MALSAIVEIAFATDPDSLSPTWTDVSRYVRMDSGYKITRGRGDRFSDASPGVATLTLVNSDGRFTPGRAASPYFPHVVSGKRLRISVTDGTTTWRRFDGRVDQWPVGWAAGALYSEVTITARDRLATLELVDELPNVIACEYLNGGPIAYYMLGDPAGTTAPVDSTEEIAQATGHASAGVTFGTATGPGTDGITAAALATNATVLAPLDLPAGSSWTLSCFYLTTASTAVSDPDMPFLMMRDDNGNAAYIAVAGNSSNQLAASQATPLGIGIGGGAVINDGKTHHAALTFDATTNTIKVYGDGTLIQSTTTGDQLAHVSELVMGTGRGAGFDLLPFAGTMAHCAVFDSALTATQVSDQNKAGVTGFAGETASARIQRLARWCGVDSSEVSVETGRATLAILAPDGKTAVDLMRSAELSEPGFLFMSKTNVLTFQARRHRWNLATSLTLGSGTYSTDLSAVADMFGVVNDMKVTREGLDTVFRSVDTTARGTNGHRPDSLSLSVDTDAQAADRARWEVGTRSKPGVRWPTVTVDVLTQSSVRSATLNTELGSRITLTSLPSTAPASSVDLIVEGSDETFSQTAFDVTFNCSNYSPTAFWTLDNATLGKIDSGNSLGL